MLMYTDGMQTWNVQQFLDAWCAYKRFSPGPVLDGI